MDIGVGFFPPSCSSYLNVVTNISLWEPLYLTQSYKLGAKVTDTLYSQTCLQRSATRDNKSGLCWQVAFVRILHYPIFQGQIKTAFVDRKQLFAGVVMPRFYCICFKGRHKVPVYILLKGCSLSVVLSLTPDSQLI